MLRTSILVLVLSASTVASLALQKPTAGDRQPIPPPEVVEPPAREWDLRQEIFFGVLEGLYHDGVQNEVVDRVIELDPKTNWPAHFVYACPICMPAFDAFRVYRARPAFFGDKGGATAFGDGLSDEESLRIQTEPKLVQSLVEKWMRRRMDDLRLTDAERARWTVEMEERRKKGMEQLSVYRSQGLVPNFGKLCPFCEAGNDACKMR
jgi:hypothetical protein